MAPSVTITTAEILDALAACTANDSPEEARTVKELAEETGLNVDKVRDALHHFKRANRLTVHRVRREALDGRLSVVTAYTIAPG